MTENVFEGEEVPQEELDNQVEAVESSDESIEVPEEKPLKEVDEEVVFGDLSNNISYDIKLSDEDKGKVFVISEVERLPPRLKDENGNKIPMPVDSEGKQLSYYKTKLSIKYEGCNYISYLPSLKWFYGEREGKKVLNPWFGTKVSEEDLDDNFTAVISKVYYKYCVKFGYEVGKLTQAEFVAGLVGKKVLLENKSQKNPKTGKMGNRIDIKEFV